MTRTLTALAATVMLALPASAHAGSNGSGEIIFPTQVTVGQTNQPASIAMENRNTFPDENETNGVCNIGDASPPCDVPEPGVELVPACKQVASGKCTAAGVDAGVFALSSRGTGRQGSACAGMLFAIVPTDPTAGTVRFEPLPAGAHVLLPGFGAKCIVDFTFDVRKAPTGDQDPAPGLQTAQAMRHGQWTGTFGPGALSFFGRTTSNTAPTVLRAASQIATSASPGVVLGGQLTDTATVSGLVSPDAGSTVTFALYPPAAGPGCAGAPIFTSTKPVTLNGATATATSDPFTPAEAGTYRWVATFNGDTNNAPVTGTCGEPAETREVTPVPAPRPGAPTPTTTGSGTGCSGPATTACPVPTVTGSCVPTATTACPAARVIHGTAAIAGRTGCVDGTVPVTVTGTRITKVVFRLDRRRVRTLTRPNATRARYVLSVRTGGLEGGTHRVIATVTFAKASATRTRTLRLAFARCTAARTRPVFTGR